MEFASYFYFCDEMEKNITKLVSLVTYNFFLSHNHFSFGRTKNFITKVPDPRVTAHAGG